MASLLTEQQSQTEREREGEKITSALSRFSRDISLISFNISCLDNVSQLTIRSQKKRGKGGVRDGKVGEGGLCTCLILRKKNG